MNPLATIAKDALVNDKIAVKPQIPLTDREHEILALYKNTTPADWEYGRWHLRNRIRTQ